MAHECSWRRLVVQTPPFPAPSCAAPHCPRQQEAWHMDRGALCPPPPFIHPETIAYLLPKAAPHVSSARLLLLLSAPPGLCRRNRGQRLRCVPDANPQTRKPAAGRERGFQPCRRRRHVVIHCRRCRRRRGAAALLSGGGQQHASTRCHRPSTVRVLLLCSTFLTPVLNPEPRTPNPMYSGPEPRTLKPRSCACPHKRCLGADPPSAPLSAPLSTPPSLHFPLH